MVLVKELILNDTSIEIHHYEEEKVGGLHKISVEFEVTSEEYHDITTLLYKETFHVKVPEKELAFKGKIQQYSTSVTNLYEKNQTANYALRLLEVE